MNTTAIDAAIEELEQLIEIEEAGYRLVSVRHRQKYIGVDSGPWEESWHGARPTCLPATPTWWRLSTAKPRRSPLPAN